MGGNASSSLSGMTHPKTPTTKAHWSFATTSNPTPPVEPHTTYTANTLGAARHRAPVKKKDPSYPPKKVYSSTICPPLPSTRSSVVVVHHPSPAEKLGWEGGKIFLRATARARHEKRGPQGCRGDVPCPSVLAAQRLFASPLSQP